MSDARSSLQAIFLSILVVSSVVVGVAAFTGVGASQTSTVNYSSASISPSTIFKGSMVDATITVTNTEGSEQPYNVSVLVDGTVEQWANGTVAANSNKDLRIRETLWETGDHTVTVSGGSKSTSATVTVQDTSAKYHGGPANLGFYPDQFGPQSQPIEAWNLTDDSPLLMQPTIANGTLFMAFYYGKFYAVDPVTGAEKWSVALGGGSGSTWSTPAYANGVLYIGNNDAKLHAIDEADGSELWSYSTPSNVRSAPAVVDGVVYAGSNDGNMTAVNATTGDELWQHTLSESTLVESNPAVVDGVVYFGAADNNVTALNAATGAKIWNYTTIDQVQSDATVAQNTVYIGSDSTKGETSGDGRVYALNATDGTKRWSYSLTGDVDAGVVYANETVYAGSRGGDLVALNATTGTELWSYSGSDFLGAPVVAGEILYVSDYDTEIVHAFDTDTGTQLWQYASPTNRLHSTPLAWNGSLYYGSISHL
jgi:outer membrane protein assembly factor BamB